MGEFKELISIILSGQKKVRYRLRYVDYEVNQWTMPANLNDNGLKNLLNDQSVDGVEFILDGYSVTLNERI